MMANIVRRFEAAAEALAGDNTLQQRLDYALMQLMPLSFDSLPSEVRSILGPLEAALASGVEAAEMCEQSAHAAAVLIVRAAFYLSTLERLETQRRQLEQIGAALAAIGTQAIERPTLEPAPQATGYEQFT